jgi:hypothetical protein
MESSRKRSRSVQHEFPRDIQKVIVRKLDIDTRRAMGVYCRIRCPEFLAEKLNIVLTKAKTYLLSSLSNRTLVALGKSQVALMIGQETRLIRAESSLYHIVKDFDRVSMSSQWHLAHLAIYNVSRDGLIQTLLDKYY